MFPVGFADLAAVLKWEVKLNLFTALTPFKSIAVQYIRNNPGSQALNCEFYLEIFKEFCKGIDFARKICYNELSI